MKTKHYFTSKGILNLFFLFSLLFIHDILYAQCNVSEEGSIGNYVWEDSNDNGIQDGIEFGVEGILVRLLDIDGNELNTAITNEFGNYTFLNLCPGFYKLHFVLPNSDFIYARQAEFDLLGSDPDSETGETLVFELDAGIAMDDIDAGIVRKRFCGYTWEDVDKNGVIDPTDTPLEKVTVFLKNQSGTTIKVTTTNSNGEFIFTNVFNGTYYIEFNPNSNSNGMILVSGTHQNNSGPTLTDDEDSDMEPFTMRTDMFFLDTDVTACNIGAGFLRSVLPVELVSFEVARDGNDIVLDWLTASEENNSHFEIEFGTSPDHFTNIGREEGVGNSTEHQYYQFRHENVSACSNIYYRLKQVDFDGTYEYSEVRQLVIPCKDFDGAFSVFPNPVRESKIHLELNDIEITEPFEMIITNGFGQLVKTKTINPNDWTTSIPLDINDFDTGIYFVRLEHKMFNNQVVKFIRVND